MKIGILTLDKSGFGKGVLDSLRNGSLKVDWVFVVQNTLKRRYRLFKLVARKIGLFNALVLTLIRIISEAKSSSGGIDYRGYCDDTEYFISVRSEKLKKRIREAGLDILILAQSGIVDNDIIHAPRLGVINSHPGILPYYRGLDCPLWAIYKDDFKAIGSTLHWVDEGIDTGKIISQRRYLFTGGETVFNLEQNIMKDCSSLIVEFLKHGDIYSQQYLEKQDLKIGQYTFKMPISALIKTASKLRLHLKAITPDT